MKTFWIILIIVIILALAGGTLWYFKSASSPYIKGKNLTASTLNQQKTPDKASNSTSTSKSTQEVKIYLVAVGDAGKSGEKIGCDDSLVSVNRTILQTQAVLKASIEDLLSVKTQNYGESGLVNSLYQSNLTLQSATIDNGKATVKLTGNVVTGGTCDNPRIEEQLKATALQFSTVKEVQFFVNDKTLEEVLSLK